MVVELTQCNYGHADKLKKMEDTLFVDADADSKVDHRLLSEAMEAVREIKLESCCRYIEDLFDSCVCKFLLFAHHRIVLDCLEKTL